MVVDGVNRLSDVSQERGCRHVCWFCLPFRGQPTAKGWLALIDCLSDLRRQHGIDLVVIDPLASFLPGRNENNASVVSPRCCRCSAWRRSPK